MTTVVFARLRHAPPLPGGGGAAAVAATAGGAAGAAAAAPGLPARPAASDRDHPPGTPTRAARPHEADAAAAAAAPPLSPTGAAAAADALAAAAAAAAAGGAPPSVTAAAAAAAVAIDAARRSDPVCSTPPGAIPRAGAEAEAPAPAEAAAAAGGEGQAAAAAAAAAEATAAAGGADGDANQAGSPPLPPAPHLHHYPSLSAQAAEGEAGQAVVADAAAIAAGPPPPQPPPPAPPTPAPPAPPPSSSPAPTPTHAASYRSQPGHGLPCALEVAAFLIDLISRRGADADAASSAAGGAAGAAAAAAAACGAGAGAPEDGGFGELGLALAQRALLAGGPAVSRHPALLALLQRELFGAAAAALRFPTLGVIHGACQVASASWRVLGRACALQLEALVQGSLLPLADGREAASAAQQEAALEGLLDLCRQPGLLHAAYLACDCRLERSDLFADLVALLCAGAAPGAPPLAHAGAAASAAAAAAAAAAGSGGLLAGLGGGIGGGGGGGGAAAAAAAAFRGALLSGRSPPGVAGQLNASALDALVAVLGTLAASGPQQQPQPAPLPPLAEGAGGGRAEEEGEEEGRDGGGAGAGSRRQRRPSAAAAAAAAAAEADREEDALAELARRPAPVEMPFYVDVWGPLARGEDPVALLAVASALLGGGGRAAAGGADDAADANAAAGAAAGDDADGRAAARLAAVESALKRTLAAVAEQFNRKPKRGIELLQRLRLLPPPAEAEAKPAADAAADETADDSAAAAEGTTKGAAGRKDAAAAATAANANAAPVDAPLATALACFLRACPGLSKAAVGEVLGEPGAFSAAVLDAFTATFDFGGLSFEAGARAYLEAFRLPGEAQKIDRIVNSFGRRYYGQAPDLFRSEDAAYVLAYSVIMLNTDRHNAQASLLSFFFFFCDRKSHSRLFRPRGAERADKALPTKHTPRPRKERKNFPPPNKAPLCRAALHASSNRVVRFFTGTPRLTRARAANSSPLFPQ